MNDNERRQAIREHFAPVVGWEAHGSDGVVDLYVIRPEDHPDGYLSIPARDLPALAWAILSAIHAEHERDMEVDSFGDATISMWNHDGLKSNLVTMTVEGPDPMRAVIDGGIAWAKGQNK